jgi:hypothetical protein
MAYALLRGTLAHSCEDPALKYYRHTFRKGFRPVEGGGEHNTQIDTSNGIRNHDNSVPVAEVE